MKADKRNVATIVMKRAAPRHRTRTLDDDLAVALCADTSQLLQFTNERKEAVGHQSIIMSLLINRVNVTIDTNRDVN